jgi:hypothetical protein
MRKSRFTEAQIVAVLHGSDRGSSIVERDPVGKQESLRVARETGASAGCAIVTPPAAAPV